MEATCLGSSNPFTHAIHLHPSIKPKRKPSPFQLRSPRISSPATRCQLGSPSPSNDPKPSVDGADWRSFRAKLVAGEQAAPPEDPALAADPPVASSGGGDQWVHALHAPETGCLLIASEKLDGVHIFERTVILLLAMGPVGPTGVILNRPSLMSIKETRSTALDAADIFADRPPFFGGPLEDGLFLVGPQDGSELGRSGVFEEVMSGLYYGAKESVGLAAEMVKRNVVGIEDFRFFDGYCGWEREQLNDEIRAGYWTVAACSPTVIGLARAGSVGLWDEVLGLMGPRKVL